jgi:hypothetical protein
MLEWLILIVLVPAVLVPVVLLFGFAGCDVVWGFDRPADFGKSFEAVLADERQRRSRTIIQRIEPTRLFKSGSQVRLTIQRPAGEDLIIDRLFISQAADAGDAYDAAPDLTAVISMPMLVSADPGNALLELPPVQYQFDHTRPLLLAFDIGALGLVRVLSNVPPTEATAFVGPVQNPPLHQSALADRQTGYSSEDRLYLVQRIDVA